MPAGTPIETVIAGLQRLGVPVRVHAKPNSRAFIPETWLDRGIVRLTLDALPGDVLHEAGHLAVWPAMFRGFIRPGNMEHRRSVLRREVERFVASEEAFSPSGDNPTMRGILQAGEQEAIAWSFAAAVAIGVAAEEVFMFTRPGEEKEDRPFGDEGEYLMLDLSHGYGPGISGLHHAGMCDKKQWPTMKRWMQE